MERIKMSRVVKGQRYDTEKATLIADDVYWDGHNFERRGRNQWLYRTQNGAYFTVYGTFWQGERDHLEPVSKAEAVELYENDLTEHSVEYEEAFNIVPTEPEPEPGRPPIYDENMEQTGIRLPRNMLEWLKAQPGGMSETIRALVQREMEK